MQATTCSIVLVLPFLHPLILKLETWLGIVLLLLLLLLRPFQIQLRTVRLLGGGGGRRSPQQLVVFEPVVDQLATGEETNGGSPIQTSALSLNSMDWKLNRTAQAEETAEICHWQGGTSLHSRACSGVHHPYKPISISNPNHLSFLPFCDDTSS